MVPFLFEIRTVIALLAIGNLMALVILLAYRNGWSRQRPCQLFMAGKVLEAFGWGLLSLRDMIPDALSVHLGNILLITGFALEGLAIASVGRPEARLRPLFASLGGFGVLLLFAVGHSPGLRVSVASLACSAIFGTTAAWMIRPGKASRLQSVLGLYFGAIALCLACRAALPLFYPGRIGLMTPGLVQSLSFLLTYVLMLGGGIGFLLLIQEQDDLRVRESEAMFTTLFRAAPNAILLTRLEDGTLLEVNEGFEKMTGYAAREVLGKTTVEMPLYRATEAREALMGMLHQAGRVSGLEWEFQNRAGETITGLYSAEVIELRGERFVLSIVSDITERKVLERERERMIRELQAALSQIRALKGLLPICASCKKIRDDQGYWNQLETYISEHSEAEFTHGLCPECAKAFFPSFSQKPPKDIKPD